MEVLVFAFLFSSCLSLQIPVAERVQTILKQMTLQEKINELHLVHDHLPFLDDYVKNKTGLGGVKMAALKNCTDALCIVQTRNKIQKELVESSRLGIPAMFVQESLHGGASSGIIFPMPCLMGTSWNADLVRKIYDVIGKETRALGADLAYAPVLNVFTDPRFGRIQEGFSEDPFLVSILGAEAAKGLQGGNTDGPESYIDLDHVVSLGKHFAAYGKTQGGLNASPSDINERVLREIYLKPWKAFAEAGGRGAMPAHNTVFNVPCHSNEWLLSDVFRKEFGLDSAVTVSDCNDIGVLVDFRAAANLSQAAALSAIAGVDLDLMCGSNMAAFSYIHLMGAVEAGLVNESVIDDRAKDVLTEKFAAGLFDHPYANESKIEILNSAAGLSLALQAAEEGIVLLKNSDVLPLKLNTIQNIAVIGPNSACFTKTHQVAHENCDAQSNMLGSYLPQPSLSIRYVDTILNVVSNQSKAHVKSSQGCYIDKPTPDSMIDEAVDVASKSDVVLVVLGDSLHTCGEWSDRDSLDLPGDQLALLEAVTKAVQKPSKIVVILVNGRPATFGKNNKLLDDVGALLVSWRAGQFGSQAIWNILSGRTVPSGKLSQSWPRSVGQIGGPSSPWYSLVEGKWLANHRGIQSGQAYDPYVDGPSDPLFPFGFGLSYTAFTYSNVIAKVLDVNRSNLSQVFVKVSVSVKNVGEVSGIEIVQIYLQDPVMNLIRYWKRLIGFAKVMIEPDTSTLVEIDLIGKDLAFYDQKMEFRIVPGQYTLIAGGNSADVNCSCSFVL
eukprot:m.111566 g.111566  ORF g.111566 m.111566 type:complete len:779 (+) comp37431_c1_seq6:574-2910(+)